MSKASRNLEAFQSLGKPSWQERVVLIKQQFPAMATLDWVRVFKDVSTMGRIIEDILKVDQAPPGRVGKRASLDHGAAEARFRQIMGQDFSVLPFHEAFRILVGDRSLRGMANRLGVSHTHVRNLLNNTTQPDAAILEKAAAIFKKNPEYFLEYRMGYILGTLNAKLESSPEATIGFFRKMKGA